MEADPGLLAEPILKLALLGTSEFLRADTFFVRAGLPGPSSGGSETARSLLLSAAAPCEVSALAD